MMKLSVVIPTYRRLQALALTLESLLKQGMVDSEYEIIVVDDGSSDGTKEFMREFILRHKQVRYFNQAHKGPAAARNLGIKHAQGRYIFFTGDDIIASQRLLKEHLDTLEANPTEAVLGFTVWAKGIQPSEFMDFLIRGGHQFNWQGLKKGRYCSWRVFYTSNVSLKRSWLEAELFDENLPYPIWEDIELSYRLFKKGLKITFNPDALAYHRHFITQEEFYNKIRQSGISRVYFYGKHPELKTLSFKIAATRLAWLAINCLFLSRRLLKLLGLNVLAWELNLWYYAMLGIRQGQPSVNNLRRFFILRFFKVF